MPMQAQYFSVQGHIQASCIAADGTGMQTESAVNETFDHIQFQVSLAHLTLNGTEQGDSRIEELEGYLSLQLAETRRAH